MESSKQLKMKTKRPHKAEPKSLDRISSLPQPILDTILCLLTSTEEAVRTSILSKEWRYKWTTIPKLELSHRVDCVSDSEQTSGVASSRRNMDVKCKACYYLYQILSQHRGPIHELIFKLPKDNCLVLAQILPIFSMIHTIKKLEFHGWDVFPRWYKLPVSVFSFHHITELGLSFVDLDYPPIFSGSWGSLRSLNLFYVYISREHLLRLLSDCSSLKKLSLSLGKYILHDNCTINELFKCLPEIEHFTTCVRFCMWLELDLVPQEPPASLIHLKHFCLKDLSRVDGYGLAFLLVLIKCSPNLETIKLEVKSDDYFLEHPVVWEEYSDVWLGHLKELEIECFMNSKNEMEFVKFILARSPMLKKVIIGSIVDRDQEPEMLKALLQAPRVSPAVITVGEGRI